ncbi:MAG TPA: electron transfer flavoprotein subunit beta/FixA family protein [Anaerolineales bacterium]|nr:electron transfer flavoprotein subunit beta/FixA family protein [Anaerolineales bacterium]
MKIVVCVKQVPDTAAKLTVENGKAFWGDAPLIINPWDEYAVEAALMQDGADVIAISMGSESALDALKHALAMGCNEAFLVSDPALIRADSQATAKTLAAAIQKIGSVDLVVFGRQAVDSDGGITAAQTARALGWPVLSLASSVSAGGGTVKVTRSMEEGQQMVEGQLPAVVSVVKDIGEPRYPSFMGIRKASRAQIPTWTLADLGISAPTSVVHWPELISPPSREVICEIITGDSPEQIAATLADKILAEKVI